MILMIDDGTDCHQFFSDPGQTSMCLKLLLCNQGTPPVILTKNINNQKPLLKLLILLLKGASEQNTTQEPEPEHDTTQENLPKQDEH